jgi:hypothetical protein
LQPKKERQLGELDAAFCVRNTLLSQEHERRSLLRGQLTRSVAIDSQSAQHITTRSA